MKKDTNILAELLEVAPTLAAINNTQLYTLPKGYFNALSEVILAQISAENLPKIIAPFTVPQDYFNTISNNVLAAIAKEVTSKNEVFEELEAIAPLLNTINKRAVYTLPTQYFASFKPSIATVTIKGKLVPMASFRRKLLYVAAACVIGLMAVGAFVFTNKTEKIDYAAYKKIDVNTTINTISNEELINYLENVNSITNANALTTLDVKLPDIQDHIETIPEEELKQYLKEVDAPTSEDNQLGI
jgi:hypothetical protein